MGFSLTLLTAVVMAAMAAPILPVTDLPVQLRVVVAAAPIEALAAEQWMAGTAFAARSA